MLLSQHLQSPFLLLLVCELLKGKDFPLIFLINTGLGSIIFLTGINKLLSNGLYTSSNFTLSLAASVRSNQLQSMLLSISKAHPSIPSAHPFLSISSTSTLTPSSLPGSFFPPSNHPYKAARLRILQHYFAKQKQTNSSSLALKPLTVLHCLHDKV